MDEKEYIPDDPENGLYKRFGKWNVIVIVWILIAFFIAFLINPWAFFSTLIELSTSPPFE